MKTLMIILTMAFAIHTGLLHGQASFGISESGDTINLTDENGLKQGYWDVTERNVRSRGHYQDGQMHGSWLFYHPRGFLARLETYENGRKNGIYIAIDSRGYLSKEEFYVDDELDGLAIEYKYGGNPQSKIHYRKGVKHGKLTITSTGKGLN